MAYLTPTPEDFKDQFPRDFAYAIAPESMNTDDTNLDVVRDQDIFAAQTPAKTKISSALIESQELYTYAFNLLTAHFLALNIQASSQGVGSQSTWLETFKAVGDLKAAYSIPDRVKKDPVLNTLARTQYGAQYLSLVLGRTVGNVAIVPGETQP